MRSTQPRTQRKPALKARPQLGQVLISTSKHSRAAVLCT